MTAALPPLAAPAPTGPFPYTMQTTAVIEHSRGIAWTATLFRNGRRVGFVEQLGTGGCDVVTLDTQADRITWKAAVTIAFAGDEEAATYFLLVAEAGL